MDQGKRSTSHGGTDWMRLRLWQIQPLRDTMVILGVLGVLYVGYMLRVVTIPLLLAIALAYLFEPLVERLTRRRWLSRGAVAAGIIVVAGVAIVVPLTIGIGFGAVQGVRQAQRLATDVDLLIRSVDRPEDKVLESRLAQQGKTWAALRDWIVEQESRRRGVPDKPGPTPPGGPPSTPPTTPSAPGAGIVGEGAVPTGGAPMGDAPPGDAGPLGPLGSRAGSAVRAQEPSDLYNLVRWVMGWVRENAELVGQRALRGGAGALQFAVGAFGSIGAFAFGSFLTAFFFFFACTGYGRVLEFWRGLIPARKQGRAIELARQMDRVIAGFVRGRLTICAIMIVLYTVGYVLIGVPAPLIVGPIVGASVVVPYLASIVGIPVSILLLALQPPGGWMSEWWWIVFAPIGIWAIGQFLDDYVLTPRIQGKSTNMDTPTILFASIAGGVLAGVYGLLLAIPAAACIKILLQEVFWPRFRAWSQGKAKDPLPIAET